MCFLSQILWKDLFRKAVVNAALLPQAQSRGNPSLPTRDFIPLTAALPGSVHFTHTTSTRCNISITVFSSTAYTAFCFHTIISLKCVFRFLFLEGHQCLYLFFHTLLTSWPSCWLLLYSLNCSQDFDAFILQWPYCWYCSIPDWLGTRIVLSLLVQFMNLGHLKWCMFSSKLIFSSLSLLIINITPCLSVSVCCCYNCIWRLSPAIFIN